MGRAVKARKPSGVKAGFEELSEGGQDAEAHAYPMLPQKKKEGRFAINTRSGAGSKNKGPLKGNKG